MIGSLLSLKIYLVLIFNSSTAYKYDSCLSRNEIEAGRAAGKPVVAAGCVPQGAPKADFLRGLSVIGVQQIDRVVEVVEETLKGKSQAGPGAGKPVVVAGCVP